MWSLQLSQFKNLCTEVRKFINGAKETQVGVK